jgi:putative ABC transport system permease protein
LLFNVEGGGGMKYDEKFITINEAFECDCTFFELFDTDLIVGNPENILNSPGSMIVSESFSRKVFGKLNPVGQILTLPAGQYYGENQNFTINGIMKDFPQNSHFHPELITTPINESAFEGWAWTYLLLHDKADPGNIQTGFKDFYHSHIGSEEDDIEMEVQLQNVSDIHLHSNKLREIEANSNMTVIYSFSIAVLILLFIALVNYANLNIGMAGFSDKYLYINKVCGSSPLINLKLFISEAIIISLASLLVCAIIAAPVFMFIQNQYGLNLFKENISYIISVVLLFGLLSILYGILPFLKQQFTNSSIDFKNISNLRRKGISKGLLVFQYTITIALFIAIIVIHRQTTFALQSSMGVEANNLICFESVHSSIQHKFEIFKEELLKYNSIESVSAMLEPPGGEANDMFRFTMEGIINDPTDNFDNMIGVFPCDYSFASIFNLNFLSGENFSEDNSDNEGSGEYIINEKAMRKLNHVNPEEIIGKHFGLEFNSGEIQIPSGKIIGVVEDFHLSSLKKDIEPLVMFKRSDLWLINFVVSLQPGMQEKALTDIESVWTKMFPEYPFQYNFVSSIYENVYSSELSQARLISVFALVALFVCSMGLLGLSLLSTQYRTKEVGIRKINGARISEIMILLNWDLLKWILISFVIAIPIALYLLNIWLENFAYKIQLSWWIFVLPGLAAILISLLTVSFNTWKAANNNPVEALRYE